jgi:O-antigen/teichoic acid export membrane protein
LLLFGALPTLAMGVLSALIAGWVFGPSWSEAGVFMLILSPSYAAGLVAVPLSSTLVITEMLGREALWDSVRLLLVLASILVPFALGLGVTTAIISFSAVMVLTYAALLVLTRHASKGTRTQGTDVQV